MLDVYFQQDGGPLPSTLAATLAAALPERPPETTTATTSKHKRKDSRSFRSFIAMCESNAAKDDVAETNKAPCAKYTFNMYNASKRQTTTRVSSSEGCGYVC